MTRTLSVCEYQSTAIYIQCVTVRVSSGKTATKMCLLVPLYTSVRPSAFENSRNAERIFMTFHDMQFLLIS